MQFLATFISLLQFLCYQQNIEKIAVMKLAQKCIRQGPSVHYTASLNLLLSLNNSCLRTAHEKISI